MRRSTLSNRSTDTQRPSAQPNETDHLMTPHKSTRYSALSSGNLNTDEDDLIPSGQIDGAETNSSGSSGSSTPSQTAITIPNPPPPYTLSDNEISAWSSIAADTLKQAGPNALRGAVVAGRYFVTAYFLGRLDEKLLAPNTLISLLESTLVVLGSRCLNSISAEISRLKGAGQNENIGAVVRQGSIFATTVGLVIGALYYFANHHLLQAVGQHEYAVEEARKYFQAAAPGYLALMLFTVQQRFFQGIKVSKAALYSSTLHSALIVALSYPLMFGVDKLNISKLELTGAGWAFTAATWLTLISHTLYLYFASWLNEYDLKSTKNALDLEKILHLARVGIPSGIQCAIENASNITNSIFLGSIGGLNALTADQISLQVAQLISIANNGLGGAINPCVSHALGEKKYHNMRRYGYIGMAMGAVLPIIAFVLLLPFHQSFTSIFINTDSEKNTDITELAKHFLLWECLRQLITGMQVTSSSALQGLKDTKLPMYSSIGFAFAMNLGILFLLANLVNDNTDSTNINTTIYTNTTELPDTKHLKTEQKPGNS